MSFHILGFGAIGGLVSYYLRAAIPKKFPLYVLHRSHDAASAALSRSPVVTLERDGADSTSGPLVHESFAKYKELALPHDHMPALATKDRFLEAQIRKRWQAFTRSNVTTHPFSIQTLIVATKAHQVKHAMKTLQPRLSADSTIVLLNNGMGVYEMLVDQFFPDPATRPHFVLSVNTHGAFVKKPGHVIHAGVGALKLGIVPDPRGRDYEKSIRTNADIPGVLRLSDICKFGLDRSEQRYQSLRRTIAALTNASGLNASWVPLYDVQMAMRRKLVVNAVINPVTALIGCKNGALLERDGNFLIKIVCHEASRIFYAQWRAETQAASLLASKEERASVLETCFPRELRTSSLIEECMRVAKATAHNRSSMLSDVIKGARHTEIDFITGYLVALAKKYDVQVSAIAILHHLVSMRSAIPIQDSMFKNALSNTTT
ncbi:2-dehydropantoate 2-reductase [Obba rivulosa]|uniref:2-dehydropantoate 2-reductase n=1 Tax=Obba rivulosa TaxID=1052685 RepID=A0A8E2J503_9APHY|nr:2-dehydropantoate 2-reductase [Obba rivulosa]